MKKEADLTKKQGKTAFPEGFEGWLKDDSRSIIQRKKHSDKYLFSKMKDEG
ncbi:hypothetical protein [Parabacteroides sp. AM08-6]|uniref:hypothetical protein n=1 Tax=Parabacteroides sp. AM08-6 TaxID=2292053 RepID=UPI001314D750|nr:hypothetical protein [Parabacteroides sp. AM08-6]